MLRFVIFFLLSFGSVSVFAESPALTTKGTSACDWKWVREPSVNMELRVRECTGSESVRWNFEAQRLTATFTSASGESVKKLYALVLARRTYENNEQTIRWWWRLQNSRESREQCVLQKVSRPITKLPGAQMWTFVPTPAYRQELLDKELPDDEPCGEWGASRNVEQFYIAFDDAAKGYVVFVRTKENEPNIDWSSLRTVSNASTVVNSPRTP